LSVETSNTATIERPPAAEQPVIVVDKVSLAFDDKVVLKEVSFTLMPGHTKVILGASGSGKSTILKLILGLWKPDDGAIWVNGQRVDTMT
jgi:phospholipid/cholesterol/gamma-HCH transport system ATP-binding protein